MNMKFHSPENHTGAIHEGQIILKSFFGVFNFFQKTNKNMSHTNKNEFMRSFFGRINGMTICFRN